MTSAFEEIREFEDKGHELEAQSRLPHLSRTENSKQSSLKDEESLLRALCVWIVDHQIGISINLLLLLGLAHTVFPKARRHTRKFFELSYHDSPTEKYGIGWDDAFLVAYWIVIFTGARVAVMDYMLHPLAQRNGIMKPKLRVRFAEQGWLIIYYSISCAIGTYIMYNSQYWLDLPQMFANWPDREMSGLFKWYYLVQFAFWLQQIVVVNIEERRKDYLQMFSHHLVTCALMFWSYGYHQTRIGNVILCIMDGVDVLFALAKVLKYLQFQISCDIAFGVFVISWFLLRHCAYLAVCYSIVVDLPQQIKFGCYSGSNEDLQGPIQAPEGFEYLLEPFRDPKGLLCWTEEVSTIFLVMLLSLQAILLMWFWMILNVVWRVISGSAADDPRSDDEEEDVDRIDRKLKHTSKPRFLSLAPVEEEVGVEDLNLSGRKPSSSKVFKKSSGNASGVSLPHDRKELLGRIGCDKQG